ncbi:TIGR01777 family protein [Flammeovirga pectinis]|uniref:TIGR01777 family protein n=1 Tax=Flammeovirga pectinis TaxID=2494373 RepID=A0A3S9P809_9BACT|nr:TIGR01777 family oxidoreductase [Flammeovirga pectinis]AZQ64340.1 TIGR01777 family protein [Flammeovirga pectinis]
MKILITGGSGLVGQEISNKLIDKGHEVRWLSRREDLNAEIKRYKWDIKKNHIDPKAFDGIDAVIHLAGKSVGEGRWTEAAKKEILDSRVQSSTLLMQEINALEKPPKVVVCASAIGIYGDRGEEELDESSSFGNDFLANVVKEWEKAEDICSVSRIVKLRIGVVLTEKGGALPKMMLPIKLGIGSPIGTGKQWISWISLEDLSNLFIAAIENTEMEGVYNAVSPNPVTNEQLTKAIGTKLCRPIFLPNVPSIALKLLLGESAFLVLSSAKVNSENLQKNAFDFKDVIIDDVLN